ncbi:hypothetical protein DH09_17820 [Bacillaceae bacterium JMAK1]|nr:hypothetical protein DH09_17820 [Bacillaceae bacterium JMAK1]
MLMNINFDHVSFTRKQKTILHDISFQLEGPKIVGLLGRNGAGKTTLLSILTAFQKASSGTVTLNNENTFENEHAVEQMIFVRDQNFEYETEKVSDYLETYAKFRPNFDHDYAKRLLKQFRVSNDLEVAKLSKGMASAMQVVIGLASRAPVTIFDEAYLGMDAPARDLFYKEVLNDFMEHPRLIILSTHLISEMETLFEEVLIIKNGRLFTHEDKEVFQQRGYRITGEEQSVNEFSKDKTIVATQQLGPTKSVMIYGSFTDDDQRCLTDLNLERSFVSLQDLFIHLTEEENEDDE